MKRLLALCLIGGALSLAPAQAQDKDEARAALNRGVAAYKGSNYQDAVAAFEEAIRLDPGNINGRLYLGSAFMVQWIPGAQSSENEAFAAQAEAEFKTVLGIAPSDKTAIASLASLAFNRAKGVPATNPDRTRSFDEAESWYHRLAAIDPNDKTAFYSLGVIAWERFYPVLMTERAKLGLQPADPGPLNDPSARAYLRNQFGAIVETGIADLNRALAIESAYADAMAYQNLLYRERADYSESKEDYQRDIATANDYVSKALAARSQLAQGPAQGQQQPPQEPRTPGVERIRVGGNVQAANLIQKVDPVYPPLAQQARVQGTVRFSVIIGRDGRMQNVQLVSGHPLLIPAATDAVKAYVYKPTLLNGEPVEVITQIDVPFVLSN